MTKIFRRILITYMQLVVGLRYKCETITYFVLKKSVLDISFKYDSVIYVVSLLIVKWSSISY